MASRLTGVPGGVYPPGRDWGRDKFFGIITPTRETLSHALAVQGREYFSSLVKMQYSYRLFSLAECHSWRKNRVIFCQNLNQVVKILTKEILEKYFFLEDKL
ncbi:MAG: hypothetical protein AB1491_11515 [Thermodesulfobacteriota bacterium]